MNVTFYKISDDPRVINKDLGTGTAATCEVFGDCTRATPSILVQYSSDLSTCNYMYIDEFERYYFVQNVTLQAGNRCIVTGVVDPLKSFENEILNSDYLISRSSAKTNLSYIDDMMPMMCGYKDDIVTGFADIYGIKTTDPTPVLGYVVLEIMGASYTPDPEPKP